MRIDIGCGQRCAEGYDVYTDVFPVKNVPGKFVLCPMEKMPFADKEFDYARVNHVIEHTSNPDKACSELIRIADAGVISFPPAQAELMFGKADHRWFVFIDKGRLLFVGKRFASYGIPRIETGCDRSVSFEWKNTFDWKVVS